MKLYSNNIELITQYPSNYFGGDGKFRLFNWQQQLNSSPLRLRNREMDDGTKQPSLFRYRIVNLYGAQESITSPGGPVRHPYLLYRPARLHRQAEWIPRNRFLASLNVYKYRLSYRSKPPPPPQANAGQITFFFFLFFFFVGIF